MADLTIAQIELAIPGYQPYVAKLAIPENEGSHSFDLDDVAKEVHELLHSAIVEVRVMGQTNSD